MADTVDGLVAMRFGHRNPKRCGQKTAGGLSVCWGLNGELGWAKKGREP